MFIMKGRKMDHFWTKLGHRIGEFLDLPMLMFENYYQAPLPVTHAVAGVDGQISNQTASHVDSPTVESDVSLEAVTPTNTVEQSPKLVDLASEILLEIVQYLGPSSLYSFRQTCGRMHAICKQFRETEPDRDAIAERSDFSEECVRQCMRREKFETPRDALRFLEHMTVLAMLERDNGCFPSRMICSICVRTHAAKYFSDEALGQSSHDRRCIGSLGRMWICPQTILSFDPARKPKEPWTYHSYSQDCDSLSVVDCRPPTVRWPLFHTIPGRLPVSCCVAVRLSLLQAFVCPHWQLKDAFVMDHYNEDCQLLRHASTLRDPNKKLSDAELCKCKSCSGQTGDCEKCGSKIQFLFDYDIHFRGTIFVAATRKLDTYKSCTEPGWLAQLELSSDFAERARAWRQTMSVCDRQFAPRVKGERLLLAGDSIPAGHPCRSVERSFARHLRA